MNAAKPCPERFEDVVALVMGALDASAAKELEGHLATCEACRAARDVLVEEEKQVRLGFEALAQRLAPVERAVVEEQSGKSGIGVAISRHRFLERMKHMILAHKRLSAAAAAAAALAVSLIVYASVFSLSGSAYALEQTAQANQQVTSLHYKVTPAPDGSAGECWIEMNPDGTLRRARAEIFSSDDGPKVSILSSRRCEVWFKIKHSRVILGANDRGEIDRVIKDIERSRAAFDPKMAFEQLQADERAGKVQIETREPTSLGQCITLTVTSKGKPDCWDVYEVDAETKLVQQVVTWRRKGDRQRVVQVREYLDYNKQFDPGVFQLELPKHVVTVDRTKAVFGLDKGNLTDDEIATKVAREFFESLIAQDYEKASRCYGGMPADVLKEGFSRMRVLRIVEIEKPQRGKHPDKNALKVPVKVELAGEGKTVKSLDLVVGATDPAAAAKSAREFFDALARDDYAAAFHILRQASKDEAEGSAGDMKSFEKRYKGIKIRVLEIGQPVVNAKLGTSKVPVRVEMDMQGFRQTREFTPYIRSESGRWTICGGI